MTGMPIERLASWVMDEIDAGAAPALALLADLVALESPSHGEGRADDPSSVVGRLGIELVGHGTELSTQRLGPRSENLIEVLPGTPGGPALVLAAHTDTVPEGDHDAWLAGGPRSGETGAATHLTDDRVRLEVGGGTVEVAIRSRMSKVWQMQGRTHRSILYGRGALDDKGPVVSVALAMRALAKSTAALGLRLGGDLIAGYTADEERDSTGIARFATDSDSWLAENGYLRGPRGPDGLRRGIEAIIVEGSFGWAPVVGHRGGMHLALVVRGAATHASTPDLGVNAVVGMGEVLTCLERARRRPGGLLGLPVDGLLGAESVAVGTTIAGGGVRSVDRRLGGAVVDRQGLNVVPDWCEATVDVRFPSLGCTTADVPGEIVRRVRSVLSAELGDRPWIVSVESVPGTYMPAIAMGADEAAAGGHPLVRSAREAATRVLRADPGLAVAPGGSDATYLVHDAGIPTLVEIGPSGGRSHDTHEFVDVGDVIDGARILALIAIDRLGVVAMDPADVQPPLHITHRSPHDH